MGSSDTTRRSLLVGISALGLSACARDYSRLPPADQIYVMKAERRLYLVRERMALAGFPIRLGFQPVGHKQAEGDGRTPEGLYFIDRKNPNSSFHLSLGLDYPNEQDIARAETLGVDPGGDIFIHGLPSTPYDATDPDWTAGCIAVRNREIEEIYGRVPVGTPVMILA